MTPMISTMKKMQDQYFTFAKRVEDPMVRVTGEVAGRLARFVPARPEFMSALPTTRELVSYQLSFRKRMVDEQALFVNRLMKAMDPVFVQATRPAPAEAAPAVKPVTRMAPRRTAKRPTKAA